MSSGIAKLLRRRILHSGPVPVATFMAEALAHPVHGYYATRDPLGRSGDFVTAPEISQTFGELLGLWCVDRWRAIGCPSHVILAELGPGRGTLMSDALRAAKLAPDFRTAVDVHLVESSPILRRAQQERLCSEGLPVRWHDGLESIPEAPIILIANEFFDALPVHQLVRHAEGWRERLVDVDGDRFRFVVDTRPSPLGMLLASGVRNAPEGSTAEICPFAITLAADIGRRVAQHGGAALIIDYGHSESGVGDTLQAVRRHAYSDILDDPGSADLTAHVDFGALRRAAVESGAIAYGPVSQQDLLLSLGIAVRAEALARRSRNRAGEIVEACRRLIDPKQMGNLFKAMALACPGQSVPPGFGPHMAAATQGRDCL